MSPRQRHTLFLLSATGLGLLLLWGLHGLPDFGHYRGPYGHVLNAVAPRERHITNVVTAVNYDYRGMDTLGEEFILFTSVAGVVLLLREKRAEDHRQTADAAPGRPVPENSEAVHVAGFYLLGIILIFGMYVLLHGHLTPGGGFQGGAIIASAWALIYLAGNHRAFHRLTPTTAVEVMEAAGAGRYVLVGLATLATGAVFLENVLPHGSLGDLLSAGTIPLINFAVGVEVTAAFGLLISEFLKQMIQVRQHGSAGDADKEARGE